MNNSIIEIRLPLETQTSNKILCVGVSMLVCWVNASIGPNNSNVNYNNLNSTININNPYHSYEDGLELARKINEISDHKEQLNIVKDFAYNLIHSQKDTLPEFEKTFRKNFRKLLVKF